MLLLLRQQISINFHFPNVFDRISFCPFSHTTLRNWTPAGPPWPCRRTTVCKQVVTDLAMRQRAVLTTRVNFVASQCAGLPLLHHCQFSLAVLFTTRSGPFVSNAKPQPKEVATFPVFAFYLLPVKAFCNSLGAPQVGTLRREKQRQGNASSFLVCLLRPRCHQSCSKNGPSLGC